MKGQSKRFVDHKGNLFDMKSTGRGERMKKCLHNFNICGIFELWRYATAGEFALTALAVVVSWGCSVGLISAVAVYGEITALFVSRHKAEATAVNAVIIQAFGGGAILPAGDRPKQMDALLQDSIAYTYASLAVIAVQFCAAAIAVTLVNASANRMVDRLRRQLLHTVLRQEIAFFDTNTSLNFAAVLTEDMEKLRQGVGEHVVMTTHLVGTVVLGATFAMLHGWKLTLAALSVVPVSVAVAATVSQFQTKYAAKEAVAYGTAGRMVQESLSAIRTVRAYAGEEKELARYKAALKVASKPALKRGAFTGLGVGLGWLLTYSLNTIVLAYGTWLIIHYPDQYNAGTIVTILFCTFMSAQNIAMCQPHLETLSTALGATRSLYALLERRTAIDALSEDGLKPDAFHGNIEFSDVFFNYPARSDVKVLRGFSLRVAAGETVALVGASGCGKSTSLQLLQRMYEPASGSVTVDGNRLQDLNLHHYRSSIGVVGQEPVLFLGTIRENIMMGSEHCSEADMIAATTAANAHHFIKDLSEGYDTVLGERGAQLSGGQKQRIAIARALLRKPAILLLDEPTSALDPHAEKQVQVALDAASAGRTTLVVSHRLSTVVNASRIVYMEKGVVLEQGTHQELLERRGAYWQLVQKDLTTNSVLKPQAESNLSARPDESEDTDTLPRDNADPDFQPFQRHFNYSSRFRSFMSRRKLTTGSLKASRLAHLNHPQLDDEDWHEEDVTTEAPSVSMLQLLRLSRQEWPLLAAGSTASLAVGSTMPIFAYLFSKIYGMFGWSNANTILAQSRLYSGLFLGVATVCGGATFLQTWFFHVAGVRLTGRLRAELFQNYLTQAQGFFDTSVNSVGALCARVSGECSAVQGCLGGRMGAALQGASTAIIGVSLALVYSWDMTLVSLLSVPAVIGGVYLEGRVSRKLEEGAWHALEQASQLATEAVINVRTVQSLGVEKQILSRYSEALTRSASGRLVRACVRGPVYGLGQCAPTIGYAVSIAYGGYLIARKNLPYEYAILVSEALIYGAWMMAEALSFAPNFAAAKRAGARIIHALNQGPAVVDEPSAKDMPEWKANGDVAFKNVYFSYPTRPKQPVLKGLSVSVAAGKSLALVGPSGCGKSTLLQLLGRSYDTKSGKVELDGIDTRRGMRLKTLRSQLGLVQQEPALFARSLRENIAYGDNSRDVPMEEIITAAQQANIHQFIVTLPNGYDTNMSEGGTSLSGGQKQRVAIARALLRNPRVLLLDEATSALDAASEKVVQAALESASAGRTTITIAHRLATVQHVDNICVINKGKVAEYGSHEELLNKRGLYWTLWQQQSPDAAP